MGIIKSIIKRLGNISLVFIILIWQVVFAGAPLFQHAVSHAAPVCTVDTAGANDVPGQKDLTEMCVDDSGSPVSIIVTWNWDELGTTGSNTMDACSLFDTNGNGNADYAVCVTTHNDPAALQSFNTYSCGDSSIDNCTNPVTLVSSGTTNCTVSKQATDPFDSNAPNGPGDGYPYDTQASCSIDLSTVGGLSASLLDVCSYPSQSTLSDASDCVVAVPGSAKLEVVKQLDPSSDLGLFDLKIDGTTYATGVGDGGSTGEQIVTASKNGDSHTVLEQANTNSPTSLSNYDTSVVCKDQHGTGTTLASGTPTSTLTRQLSVNIVSDSDVVCTFTNTRQSGTITVTKDVNNDNGGTAVASDFPLYVNSDQVTSGTSNSYTAGQSYTISESGGPSGYNQDSIVCKDGANNTLSNPFTLSSGEDVSCTITNSDIAPKLTLVKDVSGGTAKTTDWTLSATPSDNQYSTLSGSGGFTDQTARANMNYTLSESGGPTGYTAGSWNCIGGSLNGNVLTLSLADDVTCTITNTRDTGTLTVNKLLLPSSDTGLFNLSMNGPTDYTANDQGNNGTTGAQTVDTGSYTVSEAAGTGTSLSDYFSSYSCVDGQTTVAFGNATTSDSFNVAKGQSIVCTFTNTRYGSISGFKYEVNADSSKVGALQSWTIYLYDDQNHLIGTTTTDNLGNFVFNSLLAGSYTLGENLQSGWTQIYSPNEVTLTDGQNSTENNFGNFQNASISGYKFNDVNGNGTWDNGESGLSGWTINLSKSDGNGGWTSDGSTTTGSGGSYSFTDLPPNTYKVCETGQLNWIQTYPTTNDGCQIVDIALSAHDYTDTNFGNQGQAQITVVKNVDTNGDGTIDQYAASGWTWNYDGTYGSNNKSNIDTGQVVNHQYTNTQTVPSDTYSISENQHTDYHYTSVECYNGANQVSVSPNSEGTFSLALSTADNVVCTFTNTRDTGTITVEKQLYPSSDSGMFDLNINSTNYATDVGDGGTTGKVRVLTGTYTAGETAGTNTDLANYASYYICMNNSEQFVASGFDTITSSFSVSNGDNIVCTFENARLAINVVKSGPATAEPGQTVTYTFSVTNVGYLPLSNITVSDNIAGAGVYQSGDTNNDGFLDTSETWIYTANYTIPKNQFYSITNTVTACGSYGPNQEEDLVLNLDNSKQVCDQDQHTLVIPKVLAAVTPPKVLANTGQNALAGILAGIIGLLLVVTLSFGYRKR